MNIKTPIQKRQEQQQRESSLEEDYKKYTPEVADVAAYFRNVFIEKEGTEKFCPLIGEEHNALTAAVSYLMTDTPVVIKSFAGSGKSVLTNALWSLLPEDYGHEIQMGSGVSIWYDTEEINASKFLMFPELQNSADNKEVLKVLKLIGEGRNAHRDVTDISQFQATGEGIREQLIEWKPFISTFAVENTDATGIFNEEFSRRCITLYTDVSTVQNRKVIDYVLQQWESGVDNMVFMTPRQRDLLLYHIKKCIDFKDVISEHRAPFARSIADLVPDTFVVSRSAIGLFIKVVNGYAHYNFKNRVVTSDKGILLAAPQDLFYALETYGESFLAKCLNLPILAQDVLSSFKGSQEYTVTELKVKLKEANLNISKRQLDKIIEEFVDNGILDEEKDLVEDVAKYKIAYDAKLTYNMNWQEIFDYAEQQVREQYPEYADEYIQKHLTPQAAVVQHPWLPQKHNLLTGEVTQIERNW